ncbi:MAG: PAS domain-containing protein [Steroidobacteraceae bacterium]
MSDSRESARLVTPQIMAVVLALMLAATLVFSVLADVRARAVWSLVLAQCLIALAGGWILHRNARQVAQLGRQEALQLQALLERLSIATQAAGVYCWELDWNTYAITWDQARLPAADVAAASRRHFGFELGSDLFKYVHPEDQHSGGKAITESLERGEDHASFRYRLILPDGSIRHIQAFARTYTDATGKPQRSLGVSWDVTSEVQAAERAARDAATQSQLLERLSVATQVAGLQCWEHDYVQQKITWLDLGPGSAALSQDELQAAGRALLDQFVPQDLRALFLLRDAATSRREPMISTHCRRRLADGLLHHVQVYVRFFYDANGVRQRGLGAILDVTESHQRQAELEALSIRFAVATRAAQAGVWEWQEESDGLWWNEMMYTIYGFSPATFKPDLSTVIGLIHTDDLALAQAAWENALHNSGQLHVQFRALRRDGTLAHLEQVATVVKDPDTAHRRLVGITLDVSQRVAAEQRERQLQKKLRETSHQSGMAEVATGVLHNVGNVLNSLGVAASTAQSRLKASQFNRVQRVSVLIEQHRGDLAAFLLRDPRGKRLPEYLQALGSQLEKDAGDINQEIETLNGHLQYLRQIVRAQQTFARVGENEELVDVRELIDTALALQGRDLKGVEVVRELAPLPEIQVDRYKLMQIVVNFVGNARDAVASAELPMRRITLRAAVSGEQLEIAVEDTGVGIPAHQLRRVWEFGFTTKAQGHGFGLHSAAVAAQALGGSIAVHSDGPGQGACFSVRIPFKPADAQPVAPAATQSA